MHANFFSLAMAFAGLAAAAPGSNLNVSQETALDYGCGMECFQILQRTNEVDRGTVGTDFDIAFYSTSPKFNQSSVGDLLKIEPLNPTPLNVKSGTSVFRIQYVSEDLDGTLVPVTGFIAFPFTSAEPDGTFPLIAYAHGTIGIFQGCAPSNGPALFDYDSWQLLIDRGYAVVATDYAGLGNSATERKYCSFPAHVNDILCSVIAARKAFGHRLTTDWMAVGHSQGGGSVWKLAESDLVQQPTFGNYLGTVALAPATRVYDMARDFAQALSIDQTLRSYVLTAEMPYLAMALKRVLPSYNLTILGDGAYRRLQLAELAQLCTTAFMGLTIDLSLEELVSIENLLTIDAPEFEAWQNQTAPASGDTAARPILVVQGLNDTSVWPPSTEKGYRSSCAAGSEVHLSLYPGLDHSPVVVASAPEWMTWIEERFRGEETSGDCSMVTKQAFNASFAKLPSEF